MDWLRESLRCLPTGLWGIVPRASHELRITGTSVVADTRLLPTNSLPDRGLPYALQGQRTAGVLGRRSPGRWRFREVGTGSKEPKFRSGDSASLDVLITCESYDGPTGLNAFSGTFHDAAAGITRRSFARTLGQGLTVRRLRRHPKVGFGALTGPGNGSKRSQSRSKHGARASDDREGELGVRLRP